MLPHRPPPRLQVLALVASLLLAAAAAAPAATVQFAGPEGAQVRLDGRDLGLLPLAAVDLPAGVYEIGCRKRGYEDLETMLVVGARDESLHLNLRLLPLQRGRAVTGSLLYAGLGQWYSGATLRGWIYFLGETGGLLTAIAGELQRANFRDDYLTYKARYDSSIVQDDIAFYKQQADQAYDDMLEMEDLRNTGLYVAAGAYVVSLLDAWLLFPSVDVGPGMVPPTESAACRDPLPPTLATAGAHAAVVIAF
jgi:hypothetical protein